MRYGEFKVVAKWKNNKREEDCRCKIKVPQRQHSSSGFVTPRRVQDFCVPTLGRLVVQISSSSPSPSSALSSAPLSCPAVACSPNSASRSWSLHFFWIATKPIVVHRRVREDLQSAANFLTNFFILRFLHFIWLLTMLRAHYHGGV